jgi:glycosyltransferase involved in cell wall biosynthesis
MRVLVISSRFPWPSYTGDRTRASIWLSALVPHARVALVAPDGRIPEDAPRFDFFPARRSLACGMRAAWAVVRSNGLPLQSLLAAPFEWDETIRAARHELGDFDLTVVLLSRLDPWVRASLGGVKILDAIDSLRRNAEERARAARGPSRWFWRHEMHRLGRAELDASREYDRILVVSGEETSEFGGKAVAVPNSVRVLPLDPDAPRRFDFGFWGRLAYFANADAARWLIDEIWPAIRARRPNATLAIAGADATRAIRRAAERHGVTLLSPVDDMTAFTRSVRIALMPMRYGTGQLTKVLEAAEAGCAMVTTRQALRGLDALAPHASLADDTLSLADAAIALHDDQPRTHAMASALRRVVVSEYSREGVLEQLADLVRGFSERPAAEVESKR